MLSLDRDGYLSLHRGGAERASSLYVRGDLHDAAVARAEAAEAALAGARDKALREAEQMLAAHARAAVEIGSDEAGHTLWRAARLVAALRAQPEKERGHG